jgi:hypothetical protein
MCFKIIFQVFESSPVPWTFPDLSLCLVILNLYRARIWLRHCATSRKAAGLISDVIIENFH